MRKIFLVLVLLLSVNACTEPGETTEYAAGTGGIIGAGLGAIVGNQTGSTGTGLVVGALAGASTGAAVGNALEAQQQQIHTQDEAIERQEEQLKVQRSELNDLRRSTDDSISYRPRTNDWNSATRGSFGKPMNNADAGFKAPLSGANLNGNIKGSAAIKEADLIQDGERFHGGVDHPQESSVAARYSGSSQASEVITNNSVECIKAEAEVKGAERSSEAADKLFHYRRALRLCPDNASYHNGLGVTYKELGRLKDAEFEFKEALRLNPSLDQAQNHLSELNTKG